MRNREREEVPDEYLGDKPEWSSICDVKNRLVLHYVHLVTRVEVDKTIIDPDGIPLMLVDFQRVTRVRRMTDEEYEKFSNEKVSEIVKDINLQFRVVDVPEKKEKDKK